MTVPAYVAPVLARAAAKLRAFGAGARWAAFAPGRVNLIGEHTDYSGGYVLPIAIDRVCVAVAGLSSPPDPMWQAASADIGRALAFDVRPPLLPDPREHGQWTSYLRGVVRGFQDLDPALATKAPGLCIAVASSVPLGSGLSSSASLEVAIATLLESVLGTRLDPLAKAAMCRKAEHEFAGVPCGIMDQFISAMGREGHALLIDCRSQTARQVRMPGPERAAIVVINTNVRHSLASGEYAQRRASCESAARKLGVSSLREIEDRGGLTFVEQNRTKLTPEEHRAARHVVGENERTLAAAAALEAGDLPLMGRLMNQSHDSLRHDYRVSCDELDFAAETARAIPGVFGSRMTGGGFGGCAIALCTPDSAKALGEHSKAEFVRKFGKPCDVFVTHAAQGAGPLLAGA